MAYVASSRAVCLFGGGNEGESHFAKPQIKRRSVVGVNGGNAASMFKLVYSRRSECLNSRSVSGFGFVILYRAIVLALFFARECLNAACGRRH